MNVCSCTSHTSKTQNTHLRHIENTHSSSIKRIAHTLLAPKTHIKDTMTSKTDVNYPIKHITKQKLKTEAKEAKKYLNYPIKCRTKMRMKEEAIRDDSVDTPRCLLLEMLPYDLLIDIISASSSVFISLTCKAFKELREDSWTLSIRGNERNITNASLIQTPKLAQMGIEMGRRIEFTMKKAASVGHVDILEYMYKANLFKLHTHKFLFYIGYHAAYEGKLNVIKWLHTKNEDGTKKCEWNHQTCVLSSSLGHVHVMKYAIENGCEYDENACFLNATMSGIDILSNYDTVYRQEMHYLLGL